MTANGVSTANQQNFEIDENELAKIIKKGKSQGFLTYEDVTDYLPDEVVGAEKLNGLIAAIEKSGIELCDASSLPGEAVADDVPKADSDGEIATPQTLGKLPRPSDDPIRMYLSQMAVIPLLGREEEISLAKRIEIARKRYRRGVLTSNYALMATFETLKRVYAGELPFDRTIKVSLTENLTKEQIQARMPHNFKTMEHLLKENAKDFKLLISKKTDEIEKKLARKRFLSRRAKLVVLVEELSLRSRRISPMIKQLRNYSDRMNLIRSQLNDEGPDAQTEVERKHLRSEWLGWSLFVRKVLQALKKELGTVRSFSLNLKTLNVNYPVAICGWLFRLQKNIATVV